MTASHPQIENRSKSGACKLDYKNSIIVFPASDYNVEMRLQKTSKKVSELFSHAGSIFVLILIAGISLSCAAPAYKKIDDTADQLGFVRTTQMSSEFNHVVYAPSREAVGDTLHVYVEGDGIAWKGRYFINSDPTPKRALMLSLMGTDSGNTLYVGRPCYFGMVLDERCNSDYWTYDRFSEKVVASMVEVIEERAREFKDIVLLGHSGGGALVLLIAERLPKVVAVVTIAGNIDTEAWTTHHKYTKLYGSLNPATRVPLPVSIRQLHLVGGRDEVIPPALVKDWAQRQKSAVIWEVPENNHLCCWTNQWPEVLNWINRL